MTTCNYRVYNRSVIKKGIAFLLFGAALLLSLLVIIAEHRGSPSDRGNVINRSEVLFIGTRPLEITNDTKLIIFLHFHKAGGTSIISAARRRQNLYFPNNNGNPYDCITKQRIPFWTFSDQKLIAFLSFCRDHETTFIATENDWFHSPSAFDEEFKLRNRIELVTQIRNPFDRFISNYFFSHQDSRPSTQTQVPFVQRLMLYHLRKTTHHFTERNMYVRVLSKQFDHNVTAKDLEIAKRELDKFDLVTVLEMPDVIKIWAAKYGMNILHRNRNTKYDDIYAAERDRDENFDQNLQRFQEEFEILNRFDYMLYDYAKQLHKKFSINGKHTA